MNQNKPELNDQELELILTEEEENNHDKIMNLFEKIFIQLESLKNIKKTGTK